MGFSPGNRAQKGMKADTDSKVSDRRWVAEQPVVRTMGGKGARATRLGPKFPLEGKHGKTPAHPYSIQPAGRRQIIHCIPIKLNPINECLKK